VTGCAGTGRRGGWEARSAISQGMERASGAQKCKGAGEPAPLFALFYQGDVDGRIIFNGFATAKNFSDWILNFSDHPSQVKMKGKILLRILHNLRGLPRAQFSTAEPCFVKQAGFGPDGMHVKQTKRECLAV